MSKTTTTVKRREVFKAKRDSYDMSAADWARLEAMTDADVVTAARCDPDALPLEDRRPGSVGRRVSLAKRVRWRLRMSQTEFAKVFRSNDGGFRVARTLDW